MQSTQCAPHAKHFQHCEEKVQGGRGYHHEDCVEELCVIFHCYRDVYHVLMFHGLIAVSDIRGIDAFTIIWLI